MTSLTRAAIFILGLLLLLVMAGIAGDQWLSRQRETLRAEWVQLRQAEFEALLTALEMGAPPWPEERLRQLASMLSTNDLRIHPGGGPIPEGRWGFSVAEGESTAYRVSMSDPPLARRLGGYQKAVLALGLLTLLLGGCCVGLLMFFATQRPDRAAGAATGPLAGRPDLISLAGLARMSAEQQAQLQVERVERLRIQEDLNFQQMLLNRALEEKIRLGHDLHDGIIQALYATGLTLEASLKASDNDPTLARRHLISARELLNLTIRDVRSYILGLAPAEPENKPLGEALASVADNQGTGSEAAFDLDISDEAACRLTPAQQADVIQIVREAISNSIRHGQANRIAVTLRPAADGVELTVADDGSGFDLARATRGHGLNNIESRAQRLSASVSCRSAPGTGTTLVLRLPHGAP